MSKVVARTMLICVLTAAMLATVVMVGACSGDENANTSTTLSSTSADPSTDDSAADADGTVTESNERIVVDGQTTQEYEEMIPTLEHSLQGDPENLQTLQDLAIAQYNTGRYEEAAATYETMLSLENNAFTRNNYANVLRDWGKTEDAAANYETSISLDKTLITPYLNLASLLVGEGQIDEAMAVLEKALPEVSADDKERVEAYLEQLEGATTSTS